jgi:ubiquitin C-terminal hydrolase
MCLTRQNDAHEFLLLLLDAIEGEYRDVTSCLYGRSRIETRCGACGFSSQTTEPFVTLPYVLTQGSTYSTSWSTSEYMEEWRCEKCRSLGGTRASSLLKAGEVVILHVMRFVAHGTHKNASPVDIRESIVVAQHEYNLTGIVCHQGYSQHGGHYYAVCRYAGTRYMVFDDEGVAGLPSLKQVPAADPYLLIYTRVRP